MAAEADRFLAWTQLDRYVELQVLASTNTPRPPRPSQHVISAPSEMPSTPPPVTEGLPGAGATPEQPAQESQPAAEPEPGRA
jgi:hypothetical protein